MTERIDIDPATVEQYIMTLAEHGAHGETGVWRPVYGEAWFAAQRQIEQWMQDAGMATRWDAVGNVWGRVEGSDDAGQGVILTGSHIDSQLPGGRYDGALGVISPILAVTRATDPLRTTRAHD